MDRRRVSLRPASTEEVDYWSHASKSLASLSNIYANPSSLETIGRVNRLISAWPTDDVLPAEGFDNLKTNYKRLSAALKGVQQINNEEVKAIDSVLEKLDVLIALRQAPELPSQEKRNKRPRPPSPTATASSVTPPLMSAARPMTTQATSSRSSMGPSPAIPFSREPKARREALAKQLPLQEGRKVAFHPPVGKTADGSTADADENTWILAVITKCINQDKNRYEVQDVEPQEDGQPGQCYNTTLRAIIPLPDPNAPSSSAAHLNAYQEFPAGSTVMALYPDTSCFYRAEVISSPKDVSGRGMSTKTIATYKLKFEDDDDQEHSVAAQWVVEWPGRLS
ncbi:SGF29 tudor-like domain-containing protein [Suillus subalutaceus]|uniref:SGF29 tudor-like domain-containing protein n=1 Tax=Suillus subalutaceus TaxID=48586 RepID=UPI001B86568A|nr:SGF29 tudor-like domain-containing protein [Suillus subalutaceus]KAG1848715.1 SGF29 tudor-like domain-containing protein [Suillus subalutaceus]KAG1882611.1 SGF29 tudor-like domain-containing protein [Suillus subluteus]